MHGHPVSCLESVTTFLSGLKIAGFGLQNLVREGLSPRDIQFSRSCFLLPLLGQFCANLECGARSDVTRVGCGKLFPLPEVEVTGIMKFQAGHFSRIGAPPYLPDVVPLYSALNAWLNDSRAVPGLPSNLQDFVKRVPNPYTINGSPEWVLPNRSLQWSREQEFEALRYCPSGRKSQRL